MGAKRQTIEAAWIALIGEEKFKLIENKLDENGSVSGWQFSSFPYTEQAELTVMGKKHYMWRPKSLKGLETNNGWRRIESENDIPADSDLYYLTGKLTLRVWCYSNVGYNHEGVRDLYKKGLITHYRPKPLFEGPIY